MYKSCVIITGGNCGKIEINQNEHFVIACDYGYKHAIDSNIKPDLAVGDFDSYTLPISNDIRVLKYKKEKDDTDTLIAVRYAIEKKFSEIVIYGALGGRLDHQFANLQAAAFAAENDVVCKIIDENNILYAVKNRTLTLKRTKNCSVSIFAYSGGSVTVSATGLKYPLNNLKLNNLFPIGVSNEFISDIADVTVKNGIAFIIMSKIF